MMICCPRLKNGPIERHAHETNLTPQQRRALEPLQRATFPLSLHPGVSLSQHKACKRVYVGVLAKQFRSSRKAPALMAHLQITAAAQQRQISQAPARPHGSSCRRKAATARHVPRRQSRLATSAGEAAAGSSARPGGLTAWHMACMACALRLLCPCRHPCLAAASASAVCTADAEAAKAALLHAVAGTERGGEARGLQRGMVEEAQVCGWVGGKPSRAQGALCLPGCHSMHTLSFPSRRAGGCRGIWLC